MTTYARVLVQQPVLDALGRWARYATGITVMHGDQLGTGAAPGAAPPRPTPPYVLVEFTERPAPKSPKFVRELDALAGALVELTAAPDEPVALLVNLARLFEVGEVDGPGSDIGEVPVTRGPAESLADLAARVAGLLQAQLAGRVDITAGDGVLALSPVRLGDLWRVEALAGASVVLGDSEPARIVDRLWGCSVRVWIYGARTTSGAAGVAGDGNTTAELAAALLESLDEDWCRSLFDTFGMRRTNEPEIVATAGRKSHALREDRAYFDLELGVSSRYSLASRPVAQVQFGLQLSQTPAPEGDPPPVEQEIEIDA